MIIRLKVREKPDRKNRKRKNRKEAPGKNIWEGKVRVVNDMRMMKEKKGLVLVLLTALLMTGGLLLRFPERAYAKSKVKIAHATIGENGKMRGTTPGDQTGKEVCVAGFKYKENSAYQWGTVTRAIDPALGMRIAACAILGAQNDNIGYGKDDPQFYTAAKAVNFDIAAIATPVNCDCVAFAQTCAMAAGYGLYDDYRPYSTEYFTVISDPAVCSNPALLLPGDILETRTGKYHHVAVVCSVNGVLDTSAIPASAAAAAASEAAAQKKASQDKIAELKPVLRKVKAKKKKATVVWKKYQKTAETKDTWKKVSGVEVEYGTDESFGDGTQKVVVKKKKTKVVLKKLQRNTEYFVRIRYRNKQGRYSEWSESMSFTTK